MIIPVFGSWVCSWVLGAIIFYLAQKIQNNLTKWLVRIIGFVLILWPIVGMLWNMIKY